MIKAAREDIVEGNASNSLRPDMAELYAVHAPSASRLAYFLTGDPHAAEDLVQDAFVRIFARFGNLRAPDSFQAYLNRTLINLSRKHLRRRGMENHVLDRFRSSGADSFKETDLAERDEMFRALKALPHRQREALVLRFYADLPESQVAAAMGCSSSAVNSLVTRGLHALRLSVSTTEGAL